MSQPLLSVILLNFNSLRYLGGQSFLQKNMECLQKQTYCNAIEVVVVDNASTDGSPEYIEKNYPTIKLITNQRNLGFSEGNNIGIKNSKGEYVLFLNQDVFLEPNYIERIVEFLETNPKAAGAMGKLLRFNSLKQENTNIIDSLGIVIFKNVRAVERGELEVDLGQYNEIVEVFGISGAASIFRRTALEDAKVMEEYFDENFFMYKEDIDLSWRLRLSGWSLWCVPQAKAYHARTSGGTGKSGSYVTHFLDFIQNEKKKPDYVRGLSMKNQWLLLIKNLSFSQFFRWLPFILWRELQLLGFNLVFSPKISFGYLKIFFSQLLSALNKRKIVFAKENFNPARVERWFS